MQRLEVSGAVRHIYRVIYKCVKRFKYSQPIDYATDHGNSYTDRERNCPSSFKRPATLRCANQILTVWQVEGDVPPFIIELKLKYQFYKHNVIEQFTLQPESATVLG
jgi:hypothetical protein